MERRPRPRSETFYLHAIGQAARAIHVHAEVIASGADGAIRAIDGQPPQVAKIYHPQALDPRRHDKIRAMLAAVPDIPPLNLNGREYVQLAWPQGWLTDKRGRFRGYVMPRVDLGRATLLENLLSARSRKAMDLPESYHYRVTAAANLAAMVARLHELGHHVIDLKPVNVHAYTDTLTLCLLDCDGFSIRGARQRHPAHQYTDGYICPEAVTGRLVPESLGEPQDRFALAVIVFQLLNQGLHPFQGVPARGRALPSSNGERIAAGLYAYGRQPHRDIQPSPWSLHESFDDQTRSLFDRAFASHHDRPAAHEWAAHLAALARPEYGLLQTCDINPEHQHFGRGCGLCAIEQRASQARQRQRQRPRKPHKRQARPAYRVIFPPPAAQTRPAPPGPVRRHWWKVALAIVALAGGLKLYYNFYDLDTIAKKGNMGAFRRLVKNGNVARNSIDYGIAHTALLYGHARLYCAMLPWVRHPNALAEIDHVLDDRSLEAIKCFARHIDPARLDENSRRVIRQSVNGKVRRDVKIRHTAPEQRPVISSLYQDAKTYAIIDAARRKDLAAIRALKKLGSRHDMRDRFRRTVYNVVGDKAFRARMIRVLEGWSRLEQAIATNDLPAFRELMPVNQRLTWKQMQLAFRFESRDVLREIIVRRYYPAQGWRYPLLDSLVLTDDIGLVRDFLSNWPRDYLRQPAWPYRKYVRDGQLPFIRRLQLDVLTDQLDLQRPDLARLALRGLTWPLPRKPSNGRSGFRQMLIYTTLTRQVPAGSAASTGELAVALAGNAGIRRLLDGRLSDWRPVHHTAAAGLVEGLPGGRALRRQRRLADRFGRLPLHIAVRYGQRRILAPLSDRHSLAARDKRGLTALDHAIRLGRPALVAALLDLNDKLLRPLDWPCQRMLWEAKARLRRLSWIQVALRDPGRFRFYRYHYRNGRFWVTRRGSRVLDLRPFEESVRILSRYAQVSPDHCR